MFKKPTKHKPSAPAPWWADNCVHQLFPSISDNGPTAVSREVCGATSEIFLKGHRNQLLCTLNSNLLMPRLKYIQCILTQNGLHKAIRLSYPTLLLLVAVLNANMVKIKYARPKILADHLVGSRGQKWPAGHSLGITGVHCEQMSRSNGEAGRQSSSADRNVRSCARRRRCRRRWNPTRHARHPTYVYQPPHSLPWKLV